MVIRKRLAGTHLKGLVPRIALGWPPRRLFNKALLAFACLNLILLLGSCYTARWFESDKPNSSSKFWDVRVFSYPSENYDSTGTWGILLKAFPKNSSSSKYVYDIDSVTVKIARTDAIFSLKVDSLWVEYNGDTLKIFQGLWSEPFSYPLNETSKVLISSTIKTFEKGSWRLVEESPIIISGTIVVKRRNKVFPGN